MSTSTCKPISNLQSIYYALSVIPVTMLMTPLILIQGIYAKHYGLELTALAGILLISRILDAISDPLVGVFSDRYHAKYGTRKPFIVAGSLLVLLCGYFLYAPPEHVTALYVGFWTIAFYMAFTLFEIPHMTWPADIAEDSDSKAKLYSYRVFAAYSGLVFFYSIPLLPFFESTAITPETLKVAFVVATLLTFPLLFQAMRVVPSGKPPSLQQCASSIASRRLLGSSLKHIITDKPLVLFLFAFIFSGFSVGMWYGLIYIYIDAYLDMGDQYAKMGLFAFIIGLTATPLWYQLARRIGKKTCWLLATCFLIGSYIYTATLDSNTTSFLQLMLLKIVNTCGFSCMIMVTPAMLSEITDYSQWKTGNERRATYFSIKVFVDKINMATGAALSLALAGWWGFEVTVDEQAWEAVIGLKLAVAWIPAVIGAVSMIFIILSPINERRHRVIRQRLDSRTVRTEMIPVTPKYKPLAYKSNLLEV